MSRPGAAVALAAAAAAGALVAATQVLGGDEPAPASSRAPVGATAVVERRTLVERESVEGTLGYGDQRTVVNRLVPGAAEVADAPAATAGAASSGAGTLTALAREGRLVRRGGVLYRVDGEPVLLLYGATPAYRDLALGDSGDDVLQLERNLAALGHSPGTVDGEYASDTAVAVAAWQESLGLEQTGAVELGRVVFLPGARRIGAHQASLGDLLSEGTAVTQTASNRRRVSVELDVDKQALVSRGDRVTVLLPSGRTVRGRVSRVGSVARAKEDSGAGTGTATGDASTADQELVVDVTVKLESSRGIGRLDQAPVSVGIARETRRRVLAVPVTALTAREGGGYALRAVSAGRRRTIPVEPGLYADGLVEVSGRGLRAGMRVEAADG